MSQGYCLPMGDGSWWVNTTASLVGREDGSGASSHGITEQVWECGKWDPGVVIQVPSLGKWGGDGLLTYTLVLIVTLHMLGNEADTL
jgi:hypothetical protein